jgi:hypothetical protein
MQRTLDSCQILIKLKFFSTDFRQKNSRKSVQVESSCSVQAEGRIDMTKRIVAFRNFANTSKNRGDEIQYNNAVLCYYELWVIT